MRRRRLWTTLGVAAVAAAGAAGAWAQQGPAPTPQSARVTRPQVPAVATTVVPFGVAGGPGDGLTWWAFGRTAAGRLTFLTRTGASAWTTVAPGADVGAAVPVGTATGPKGVLSGAPQHAGEVAPDGTAAALVVDPTRPGADARLLVRAPGGVFTAGPCRPWASWTSPSPAATRPPTSPP